MTATELKSTLAQGFTDYEFLYEGKHGTICPFNKQDGSFFAGVNYGDNYHEFHDLQELMTAPFLAGKSLEEVAEEIALYG